MSRTGDTQVAVYPDKDEIVVFVTTHHDGTAVARFTAFSARIVAAELLDAADVLDDQEALS